MPLENTAEKWIKSAGKKRGEKEEEGEGECQERKEKQTEQMFLGGGGEDGRADGQGPAALPRGRRVAVSAGLELAQCRAGLQTAARNQTRTIHSRRVRTHTERWKQTGRGSWISTPSESKVCIQHMRAHAHTCRVRAGLCASAEAWGVWRVFGGINGLQMSGTRWREGSNRLHSLIFSGARSPCRHRSIHPRSLQHSAPAFAGVYLLA